MKWFFIVLVKCLDFSGRSRRKEFWMFYLISTIISIAFGVLDGVYRTPGTFNNVYTLVILIPTLAVGVRRLHDTDRSGWWILLPIVNLIFLAQDSQEGENRFGTNPKAA